MEVRIGIPWWGPLRDLLQPLGYTVPGYSETIKRGDQPVARQAWEGSRLVLTTEDEDLAQTVLDGLEGAELLARGGGR